MATFLKQKTVPVGDCEVSITQLSGLDRLNYMDYCTEIPDPNRPKEPAEDASQEEKERYLLDLKKYSNAWLRINFMAQARLVAYAYRGDVDDIDERHQQVMSMMTPPQVETLYFEIADFSGLSTPKELDAIEDPSDATTDSATTEEMTTQEPTDPKV
ncbi:hypothetical protein [Vibrio alginolyticus]|uniref:hypothetical protein n=1 Tax=Vibrio alginolyticus TaxID=663 RepID=UPI00215D13B5|nr:hypothetical protein [Vibrio alginolyticus]MCR9525484.1 hypothetical protein [Vibrio alginolyticus]